MSRDSPLDGAYYERIFRAAPTLLLVLDPDLFIVDVTEAYLRATMTERDALVGRHLFEAFPDNPDDPAATGVANLRTSLDRVRRDLVSDTMAVQQYDIQRPESEGGGFEVRYWSPVNSPVLGRNRELVSILHRVEDVTELVRMRAASRDGSDGDRERLDDRVGRIETELVIRSHELQAANRRLIELDRVRSTFLSRMSHELRTPLNAVLGFAQVLGFGDLDEDDREAVDQILRAGEHLLGLINDVLDIARIDAGQMNLSVEDVSIADVVSATIEMVQALANARSITIDAPARDSADHVLADRQRLVQVLLNLLSNAVKYNHTGGLVVVQVDAVDSDVRLSLRDTGPGISSADIERIFEPFERLGAELGDIEGAGVGLTITKGLVERMGGTMGVESEIGVGSTFWVELARSADPASSSSSPRRVGVGASRPPIEVVYVEDNFANLRLIERVLRMRGGVTLHAARDGVEGMRLIERVQPDVVLLDLHLPELDGASVLRQVRAGPETRVIPVVVISADATRDRIAQLVEAGANAFLTKPIDVDRLLATIDRVCGHAGDVE